MFFPNEFTTEKYTGEDPEVYPHAPNLSSIDVPIVSLVHVTHNREAAKIDRSKSFKARKKLGKTREGDGRSCGDSYRPTNPKKRKFFQIDDDEAVLPGYYSWWGVHLQGGESSLPHEIEEELKALKSRGFKAFVPDYLKVRPHSIYGNNAFVCKLEILLKEYAKARKVGERNICIRKGGTLRYEFEICYVLIVCSNNGEDKIALNDFKPLDHESDTFSACGFIGHDGKVVNPAEDLTFHARYNVSWSKHDLREKPDKYSHENVAFAFYFPQEGSFMRVEEYTKCIVDHRQEFCTKKQPTEDGWRCPNDIP